MKNKNIAIYPGSFDPITKGHLDVIKKAAKFVSKLYVVVAQNEDKKHKFSIEERFDMVKNSIPKKLSNVEVIIYEGYITNLAKDKKANLMIRGIRDSIDLNYEFSIEQFTRKTAPKVETIYFSPEPKHIFTSSSLVRTLLNAKFSKEIKQYVPKYVFNKLKNEY